MANYLMFDSIKQDFTGDASVGRDKMKVTFGKFMVPKGSSGYAYSASTHFSYDGKAYSQLIIQDVVTTGVMTRNGATVLVSKSRYPELFNFAKIKDEKTVENYNNALADPQNAELMTIEKNGERVVKPNILAKKYGAHCMFATQDGQDLDDPPFLIKFRAQSVLKYIYSCSCDLVNADGTLEPMKPKRQMPVNSLADIKKDMKGHFNWYYANVNVDKMLASGEFVSDLPKLEDIPDFIPAFSTIVFGRFSLDSNCTISKNNATYNCDFIPDYLQIRPKRDVTSLVNEMRNFNTNISRTGNGNGNVTEPGSVVENDTNNNNL